MDMCWAQTYANKHTHIDSSIHDSPVTTEVFSAHATYLAYSRWINCTTASLWKVCFLNFWLIHNNPAAFRLFKSHYNNKSPRLVPGKTSNTRCSWDHQTSINCQRACIQTAGEIQYNTHLKISFKFIYYLFLLLSQY